MAIQNHFIQMSNMYTEIKELFIENNENLDFISLDKSVIAYNKIFSSLQKPIKLILFYGKPGSGKTVILNKIQQDIRDRTKVLFLPQTFFDEKEFIVHIFKEIFKFAAPSEVINYEAFMRYFRDNFLSDRNNSKYIPIVILLDEAQLYPDILMEKIRLMADSGYFKFLFTVHKTNKEDIIAKDYFKTRIWESIELEYPNEQEVNIYINKKLKKLGEIKTKNIFNEENLDFIYFLTEGNLRSINKLLYKSFEILEYYDKNKPSEFLNKDLMQRVLEMSAITLGFLDD